MHKFSSTLSVIVRGAFLKCADTVKTAGSPLNVAVCRTLSSTTLRCQETTQTTGSPEKSPKEFSFYPPMPGEETALRWGGKKFEELPVAHIKATYNNTHIQVTDSSGKSMVRTSCGTEGFKNVKRSTPIAAQTAGIAAATKAQNKGVIYVRVVLKGLGQGRRAAMRGLTMGGLEIVSITDNTPVPHNGCRPRKARRM